MLRLLLAAVVLIIASFIGYVGYSNAKKRGDKFPIGQFTWYFAIVGIGWQIIVMILNHFGLYPK